MIVRSHHLLLPLLAMALSLGCADRSAEPPAPAATPLAEQAPAPSGEALYMEHCASCHDQPRYKAPSRFLSA